MNPDYAVTRAHGGLARLLGRAGLRDVLTTPDFEALLERLRGSDWCGAVPARTDRVIGIAAVERGIAARLQEDLTAAFRWLAGTPAARQLAAAFAPEEAWTISAILRALGKGVPPSRLTPWLAPVPGLRPGLVSELAASTNVGEAVERLATWGSPLAGALVETLPHWRSGAGTHALEVAAERAAFAFAFAEASGRCADAAVVRAHLALHVDLSNARRLLEGIATSSSFLSGGFRLRGTDLARIGALDRERRRAALAHRRGPFAPSGLPLADLQDPFRAETGLRAFALSRMRDEATRRPLSIAVVLRWLLERRAEATGLRLALRASAYGMRAETILRLLGPA